MTYLQLINAVLRRLREDEVTTLSASYTKLIGDFVNETKREVEDAWNWTALRTTKTITTSDSTRRYSLTGAGNRSRVLDAWNSTNNTRAYLKHYAGINNSSESSSTQTGTPVYYRFYGQDASGDPYVDLDPMPDGVYTLTFYMHVPQDELTATTDTLTVPYWPVIMGAWAKAISERGEDGGQNTIEQQLMYKSALADAIAMDESLTVGETTWLLS